MAELDWHAERADLADLALLDRAPEDEGIDLVAVRGYRLGRVRAEMRKRDIAAVLLSDPVNIRYATGARNMQVFSQRNAPSRYLLLTENRSILFEFTGCAHLADGLETIDEVLEALCIGQDWDGDVRVVLFVRLKDGASLDDALISRIKNRIRTGAQVNHHRARTTPEWQQKRTRTILESSHQNSSRATPETSQNGTRAASEQQQNLTTIELEPHRNGSRTAAEPY